MRKHWGVILGGGALAIAVAAWSATADATVPARAHHTAGHHSKHSKTKAPTTFASLYRADKSGVVRVTVTDCNSSTGTGSGFLLSPILVATVDHVVTADGAGATSLSVTGSGGQTVTGTVVGSDPGADLALVRLSSKLSGHVFTISAAEPELGAEVAAMGFAGGGPVSYTTGNVVDFGQTLSLNDGSTLGNLLETNSATEPGDSGGPVVTLAGRVIGLTEALTASASPPQSYAVESSLADGSLASWTAAPTAQPLANCSASASSPAPSRSTPAPSTPPTSSNCATDQPDCDAITNTLFAYFNDIDSGNYVGAWNLLDATAQAALGSEAQFAAGHEGTTIGQESVHLITENSPGNDTAEVTFETLQPPSLSPNGSTCDVWSLSYTMVENGGSWLIDLAPGGSSPCGS